MNGVTAERLMKGISNGKRFQAQKKEIERLQSLGKKTRGRWQPHFNSRVNGDDDDLAMSANEWSRCRHRQVRA